MARIGKMVSNLFLKYVHPGYVTDIVSTRNLLRLLPSTIQIHYEFSEKDIPHEKWAYKYYINIIGKRVG